jgi:hypothetical protein
MEDEMATKWGTQPGHTNKHNSDYGYVQGRKVVEQSKHGWEVARERYGSLRQEDMRPPERSLPERLASDDNLQDRRAGYPSDTALDWRRGFGKAGMEDATTKPGYLHGFRGRK